MFILLLLWLSAGRHVIRVTRQQMSLIVSWRLSLYPIQADMYLLPVMAVSKALAGIGQASCKPRCDYQAHQIRALPSCPDLPGSDRYMTEVRTTIRLPSTTNAIHMLPMNSRCSSPVTPYKHAISDFQVPQITTYHGASIPCRLCRTLDNFNLCASGSVLHEQVSGCHYQCNKLPRLVREKSQKHDARLTKVTRKGFFMLPKALHLSFLPQGTGGCQRVGDITIKAPGISRAVTC